MGGVVGGGGGGAVVGEEAVTWSCLFGSTRRCYYRCVCLKGGAVVCVAGGWGFHYSAPVRKRKLCKPPDFAQALTKEELK